jgi:hypothetical protein
LRAGGAKVGGDCLCVLLFPPKNEGRREKRPGWSAMLVAHELASCFLELWGYRAIRGCFTTDPDNMPASNASSGERYYQDMFCIMQCHVFKETRMGNGRYKRRDTGAQNKNVFRFAATADTMRTYPDAGTSRPRRIPAHRSPPLSRRSHSFSRLCHHRTLSRR